MNANAIAHLRSPGFHTGTWISSGSPVVAELAGLCGFDWLLLDLEHGCGGESSLLGCMQALRGSASALIVRVGAPHPDLIQRVLDWGADGIMVPHVDDAQTARACVRALRFPPRGTRGYSRSVRACDYGITPPDAGTSPLFFAQIESETAVENIGDIAGTEGVDVLFVGPADLAFDLKSSGAARTYNACLDAVADAARAAGRQAGILCRDDDGVAFLARRGFAVQAIDSDIGILRQRYLGLTARFSHGT